MAPASRLDLRASWHRRCSCRVLADHAVRSLGEADEVVGGCGEGEGDEGRGKAGWLAEAGLTGGESVRARGVYVCLALSWST